MPEEEDVGQTIESAVGLDDLGSDLLPQGGPSSGDPASTTDGDFDPSQITDWASVPLDKVPGPYKTYAQHARAEKSRFDRQLAEVERRNAAQLEALRTQIAQNQRTPAAPAAPAAPTNPDQWKLDILASLGISDPKQIEGASPHVTLAERVFGHLAKSSGYVSINDLAPFLQRLERLESGFVGTVQQTQNDRLAQELEELQNLGISNEELQSLAPEMAILYGKKDRTGRPYTIRTAYERLSGKQVPQFSKAQLDALRMQAGPSGNGAGVPGLKDPSLDVRGGALDPEEALRQMEALLAR